MDRRARRRAPVGRKKIITEDSFTSGDQPTQRSKSPGNSRVSIAAASPRTSVIGSSKQSVISRRGTQTPTRSSTRTVRPTAKKVALTELDNDTSDSNRTPPASITPKSTKKRKAPGLKTPKLEIERSTTKKLIVSLGTLEISDSDDVLSESPRKRQKVDREAIDRQNIINLCSEDDSEAPAVSSNGEEVIVLSGDEADCIPNRPPSVVCNTDPEVSRSAVGVDEEVKSRNISPNLDSDPRDLSLTQDVSNSLYKESLKQAPSAFSSSGHPPAFLLRSSVAVHDVPSRDVAYTEEPATPGLLTKRFFARAISAITALRTMGTHDTGVGQSLSTAGVSETAGAENALVDVSVLPSSGLSLSLEDARIKDTQAPIEAEAGEFCDVSQSNDSGVSLPGPCISQPLSGISLPAAVDLAGTPEEITNTIVESTQDGSSPKVIQLEDSKHASPPVGVEPESILQEATRCVSPEREADSSEQLFVDESNTCGDVEMRLDEPLESFSISSDIDVPMSAPDPGEAGISSIMVEEPARKDSCDTPSVDNSSTDCDTPSQSQKIHVHLIDPSIFKNPKVHILLNCLKDVIVDQDTFASFDLGYPDT